MDERVYARYMSDLAYFINLLELDPSLKYHLPVALSYLKLEKYQECVEVCKQALERFPSHCPTKTLLAEAYIKLGDIISARDLLNDVVAEDDGNYKALKLLGMVMQAEELSDRAIRYFRLAYFRVPEDTSLVKMITDLGGSIDLDDIIEEQSKRVGSQAAEVDEETKTFNEINQSIKNAELMMQDLFNDSSISAAAKTPNFDRLNEIIDATINKGYDSDSMAKSSSIEITDTIATSATYHSDEPAATGADETDNLVSDDELEKLLAAASAPADENESNTVDDPNELIFEVASETRKLATDTDTTAVTDLASDLSDIDFDIDDIIDEEISDEPEKLAADTPTSDLAGELSSIDIDDFIIADEERVSPPMQDTIAAKTGEVNLYNLSDDFTTNKDMPLQTLSAAPENIETDELLEHIGELISDTNTEIIDQIDPRLDAVKKQLASASEMESELDEDSEEHNASITADDLLIDEVKNSAELADKKTVKTPAVDVGKNGKKSSKLSLEEMLSDDTVFFSTSELDSELSDSLKIESAPFYQSDIYDEILSKSNLSIDEILSSGSPNKKDNEKVKQLSRLKKKLSKAQSMKAERGSKRADKKVKVKV